MATRLTALLAAPMTLAMVVGARPPALQEPGDRAPVAAQDPPQLAVPTQGIQTIPEEWGEDAVRRHRLLKLRYGENLAIRDIAVRWDVKADWLHGQFRQAREEFRRALIEVVGEMHGGGPAAVRAESRRLLSHFS